MRRQRARHSGAQTKLLHRLRKADDGGASGLALKLLAGTRYRDQLFQRLLLAAYEVQCCHADPSRPGGGLPHQVWELDWVSEIDRLRRILT